MPIFPAERIHALRTRLAWSQGTLARVLGLGAGAVAIEVVRVMERRGTQDRLRAALFARLEALSTERAVEVAHAARVAPPDDALAGIAVLLAPLESLDERLSDALRRTEGSMTQAARLLGTTLETVREHVERRPELWPEGVRRARGNELPESAKVATREALHASGGNVILAAKALGLSRPGLYLRLKKYPELRAV